MLKGFGHFIVLISIFLARHCFIFSPVYKKLSSGKHFIHSCLLFIYLQFFMYSLSIQGLLFHFLCVFLPFSTQYLSIYTRFKLPFTFLNIMYNIYVFLYIPYFLSPGLFSGSSRLCWTSILRTTLPLL